MVVKITVEREYDVTEEDTIAFTVHVESNRILTVVTYNDAVATAWFKEALKSPNTQNGAVLIGVKAEYEYTEFGPKGLKDYPYELLTLSVGANTLIYHLPYPDHRHVPRFIAACFQNPKVFAVGREMATVARKLKSHHGIEIGNAVDINELAVKGMKREDLDLGRYDLGRLTMAVFGKHMDVVWPEEEVDWFPGGKYSQSYDLSDEKVEFCTVEAYLCFLIGAEFIDAIDGAAGLKKKKKGKKKK